MMSTLEILLCVLLFSLPIAIVVFFLTLRLTRPAPRPCYRCGVTATTEYAGFHYCVMCETVVAMMNPGVRQDPPFGFPGASGYTTFPKLGRIEEKKKEEA